MKLGRQPTGRGWPVMSQAARRRRADDVVPAAGRHRGLGNEGDVAPAGKRRGDSGVSCQRCESKRDGRPWRGVAASGDGWRFGVCRNMKKGKGSVRGGTASK
jgi:hypothetical protein